MTTPSDRMPLGWASTWVDQCCLGSTPCLGLWMFENPVILLSVSPNGLEPLSKPRNHSHAHVEVQYENLPNSCLSSASQSVAHTKLVAFHSPAIFVISWITPLFHHFTGGPGCLSMRILSCIKCRYTTLVPISLHMTEWPDPTSGNVQICWSCWFQHVKWALSCQARQAHFKYSTSGFCQARQACFSIFLSHFSIKDNQHLCKFADVYQHSSAIEYWSHQRKHWFLPFVPAISTKWKNQPGV